MSNEPTGEKYVIDLDCEAILSIPNDKGQRDRFLAALPDAIAYVEQVKAKSPLPVRFKRLTWIDDKEDNTVAYLMLGEKRIGVLEP